MPSYIAYQQHRGSNVVMPPASSVEAHRGTAEAAASLGHTAFYRVFERTPDSVTGERFVTSFSVLNGSVREHPSVTIPSVHW